MPRTTLILCGRIVMAVILTLRIEYLYGAFVALLAIVPIVVLSGLAVKLGNRISRLMSRVPKYENEKDKDEFEKFCIDQVDGSI
jgi:hypothetical protein